MVTTGILTTIQTLVMRAPQVRRALGMPAYLPPQGGGKSVLTELKTLLSRDGDIKGKVAHARREVMRRNLQEASKRR